MQMRNCRWGARRTYTNQSDSPSVDFERKLFQIWGMICAVQHMVPARKGYETKLPNWGICGPMVPKTFSAILFTTIIKLAAGHVG